MGGGGGEGGQTESSCNRAVSVRAPPTDVCGTRAPCAAEAKLLRMQPLHALALEEAPRPGCLPVEAHCLGELQEAETIDAVGNP
jgi:hypothetical protein